MSDTTTCINQAYFNKLAPGYDEEFQKTLGQLYEELQKRSSFLGVKPGGRLLDYACGTGLCVGIDISESMVERYNANAKADGLTQDKRAAYLGDLLSPDDPSPAAFATPDFFNFDLAGVGLGFHHVDDCVLAAKRLSERLRPGGSLFIVDFVSHAPVDHGATSMGIRHHGFSEDQIRAMFDEAGVGSNFKFETMEEDVSFDHAHGSGNHTVRRVFFARGDKTASTSAQI
ncbi:2-heptaprenyl-1,4-naphthoquinone methyltransferase, putative [Metarhizium acridum CQMa 102]|uniref:2-heptaprenyl-1,4-naphthoquinone methyltransferase, putative n=1 Tax=Metarhizium acridum (strain CQMa 102) TaxID=655827 RepID=E9EDJ6_METAQ|nr:2-heptaprenyl-1,4-naphthoquinone methyltransferase, putative [Metarhizium acridum CQMa 102]EFY85992.1 2-heptaprenyl-1,4-naphthoquinone methyltransferase, putative [Metarhizium acridum CQMa 102]